MTKTDNYNCCIKHALMHKLQNSVIAYLDVILMEQYVTLAITFNNIGNLCQTHGC